MSRSVLLVVLPHLPKPQVLDPHRKANRTYLAFPYGVLTIASYLKRHARNLGAVEVLDLNLPGREDAEGELVRALDRARPDVVGFSLNYDQSYGWLKALVATTRAARPGACVVVGGSAVTTAYAEIVTDCDVDACCYSEGERGMLDLVEADSVAAALARDPWVTCARPRAGALYGDLDDIVDVDYGLVDVPAYSMREAFSPFTRFETSSRQFFIVTSRGCPFKCLAGDTPVNTIYGDVPIAELAARGGEVPVFTYDHRTERSLVATARNIRWVSKEALVRVSFDDGSHIDVTPDHQFQALKVEGGEWLSEAKDLKGLHVRTRASRKEPLSSKVISVTELEGLRDTYCLEVPETGWFYANNVLVKNCVFCAEPSFHGANMRYVSVDKVVEHVAMLKDRYGLSVLTIYDDQILMAKDRAKELFRRLAGLDIRVEMPNGVTLSYIDAEMAELMRAAGVDTIFLAIEHGSKRVLKDIIRKPIAFNRIKPTVQLLQAAGIYCQGFFVIGLPGETRAERQETRDAVVEWGLDWASFNYATPLRGSELYRQCRENGWIAEEHLPIGAIDMTEYVIRAPGMDKAEVEDFVFSTNLDVNFVHNRNMRVGRYEVARDAFEELITRHPDQPFAHYYLAECLETMDCSGKSSRHRYHEIIAASPVWRAAAERFGLEVGDGEAQAGRPHPGRVRDTELRAHQGV